MGEKDIDSAGFLEYFTLKTLSTMLFHCIKRAPYPAYLLQHSALEMEKNRVIPKVQLNTYD